MSFRRLLCVSAVIWALCVQGARADAAGELQRTIAAATTYSAGFVQEVRDEQGKVMQTTEGTVHIQRPGLFRWQTLPPFNQLIVADGQKLWRYDEDLEQVSVKALDDSVGNTPALLLTGKLEDISRLFNVTRPKAGHFQLTPMETEEGLFERLDLYFDGPRLTRMEMRDTLRQTTVIRYSDVQVNQAISASQFEFTPPAGVDVFHDE